MCCRPDTAERERANTSGETRMTWRGTWASAVSAERKKEKHFADCWIVSLRFVPLPLGTNETTIIKIFANTHTHTRAPNEVTHLHRKMSPLAANAAQRKKKQLISFYKLCKVVIVRRLLLIYLFLEERAAGHKCATFKINTHCDSSMIDERKEKDARRSPLRPIQGDQ